MTTFRPKFDTVVTIVGAALIGGFAIYQRSLLIGCGALAVAAFGVVLLRQRAVVTPGFITLHHQYRSRQIRWSEVKRVEVVRKGVPVSRWRLRLHLVSGGHEDTFFVLDRSWSLTSERDAPIEDAPNVLQDLYLAITDRMSRRDRPRKSLL